MSSYQTKLGTPVDMRYKAFNEGIKLWNVFGQNCEEAILSAIFDRIGTANKWCFEGGAADGLFFSNTRRLIGKGWHAVLVEIDGEDVKRLREQFADNPKVKIDQCWMVAQKRTPRDTPIIQSTIDEILAYWHAPEDIDLAVIDVDGQDYYLFNSLVQYRPRVILVEYDPDADSMFIPELNGKGQAGHLAMRYVAEARGYEVICRTKTNLVCVRKDLAKLLEEQPQGLARAINNADLYGPQAVQENGWKGAQKKQFVQIAAVMSVPRLGYLDTLNQIQGVLAQAKAPLGMCYGVFWHHALTRGIEKALAWRTKDGKAADYILTIDYDSYVTLDNLGRLAVLLADNPEVDIVVPIQAKRAGGELLAGTDGPVDLTQPLVPIVTGHFGFTLFKREVFERLNKPWFWEKPAPDGGWGEGRVDADIGFWRNVIASGCKPYLATQVVVGHGEEVVSWPQFEDGVLTVGYQTVKDWQEERQAAA